MEKYSSIAVFILFFALGLIEAVQNNNWLEAVIFLLLGIISLIADRKSSKQ